MPYKLLAPPGRPAYGHPYPLLALTPMPRLGNGAPR